MSTCVYSATNVYEAELVASFLERSGIRAEVRNAYASVLGGDGWVEVFVEDAMVSKAEQQIEEGSRRLGTRRRRREHEPRPDWSQLLQTAHSLICPQCGQVTGGAPTPCAKPDCTLRGSEAPQRSTEVAVERSPDGKN